MIALLLLSLSATGFSGDSLEARVAQYWDLLVGQDKASALEYVTPETRNHFINRREPLMASWRLVSVDRVSDSEAEVEVVVERQIPGLQGLHAIEVMERWVRSDQWRVAVRAVSARELMPPPSRRSVVRSGEVGFAPSELKIPFLHPKQLGRVELFNGLAEPIEISGMQWDETRFEVVEAPQEIPPGEQRRLLLRYRGDEVPKNLRSRLTVTLADPRAGETRLEIPVVYNYFSDGARGLFGLTKEEADRVRRGDKLIPVLSAQPVQGAKQPARPEQDPQTTQPPPAAGVNPPGETGMQSTVFLEKGSNIS